MSIEVRNLEKHFGSFHALKNINIHVPTGELVALLGPSGCGKTTLLRIIAGLENSDSGQILFDGQDITHSGVKERKVGFMFQSYALFRHMSVFENVAFGLRVLPRSQRPSNDEINERVNQLLDLVQLKWLAKAYPHQLSGGQRQRIALARSLAVRPKLLLLDEPFGALDAKVRKELRQWLRDIHHELNITSLLVTHDQEEALEISDQIVVMNHGHVEQMGNGSSLYHAPQTPFVTEFLGEASAFNGYVENQHWHYGQFSYRLEQPVEFEQAVSYIRPHQWKIQRDNLGAMLMTKVRHIHDMGPLLRLTVLDELSHKAIEILLTPADQEKARYQVGEALYLTPMQMQVFEKPRDGQSKAVASRAVVETLPENLHGHQLQMSAV
ncbi:MAG: sulfate ABC transporter ATP-binding protein [Pelistega sp.]|nr:sulfate ABC transporter ATP-binding protein [Pelistega sp.]